MHLSAADVQEGRAVVWSRFHVDGGVVAEHQRHDDLAEALAVAGLEEGRDQVLERLPR